MATKKNKPRKHMLKKYWDSLNYGGLIVGTLFVYLGFGPSLLPRSWIMQAVINGIVFVLGYGIGVFISYVIRLFELNEPAHKTKNDIKKISYIVLVVGYLGALWLGYAWQKNSHELVGIEAPPEFSVIGVTVLGILVAIFLLWIARVTRSFFGWLKVKIDKLLPQKIAYVLAFAVTIFLIVGIVDGFLLNAAYKAASNIFSVKNGTTPDDIARQNKPSVSGSDESLISWDSLGLQGRKFIGQVPSEKELESFNKKPSMAPVRVYAGLESAADVNGRAKLAAADLIRAGGLQRDALVVVTTTGTGWVDEQGVTPIEYMYNGNSAVVSMQYSYLPSWISFLVDKQKAREAGIALYNAVYKEWVKLPVDQRPKLLTYGESLGSFGSEAAFPALSSMQALSDGALWVGPPNSNELWSNITKNRDNGSRMVLPVYENGNVVRFAARGDDLNTPNSEWTKPRAVYLQHASDPIVWWSPSLILNKPDWFNEPRSYDVNVATRWFPVITFWQITVDMVFANGVPDGYGHKYGTLPVDAWSKIAPPSGWTNQKTQDLKAILSN